MRDDAHVWLLEFEPDEEGWGRLPVAVCESPDDAFLSADDLGTDPLTLTWTLRRLLVDGGSDLISTAREPGKGAWTVTRHAVCPAGSVRRVVATRPPEAPDGR
jgi:hypothetical protein